MNRRSALRRTNEDKSLREGEEDIVVVKKRAMKKEDNDDWSNEGFAKLNNSHSSLAQEVEELLDMTDSDEREWEAAQMAKVLNTNTSNFKNNQSKCVSDDDLFTLEELEVELEKDLAQLEDLQKNTSAMIQDLETKVKRLTMPCDDEKEDVDLERVQFYKDFIQVINEAVSNNNDNNNNDDNNDNNEINLNQVYAFIQRWQLQYPADYDERLSF